MPIFTIDWMEKKPTSKGEVIKATLKGEDGFLVEDVTIWGSFPGYSELRPGASVRGSVNIKQNGKFTNKSLYEDKGYIQPNSSSGSFKREPSGAVKAAEITSRSVQDAQKRKELSIAYFNATNSAISMVTECGMYDTFNATELKEVVRDWRDWFLEEFEKWESLDVKDKTKPF